MKQSKAVRLIQSRQATQTSKRDETTPQPATNYSRSSTPSTVLFSPGGRLRRSSSQATLQTPATPSNPQESNLQDTNSTDLAAHDTSPTQTQTSSWARASWVKHRFDSLRSNIYVSADGIYPRRACWESHANHTADAQAQDTPVRVLAMIEADVVRGMWTCCRRTRRDAPGCCRAAAHHVDPALDRCARCAAVYRRGGARERGGARRIYERWAHGSACRFHSGRCGFGRLGPGRWDCCGGDADAAGCCRGPHVPSSESSPADPPPEPAGGPPADPAERAGPRGGAAAGEHGAAPQADAGPPAATSAADDDSDEAAPPRPAQWPGPRPAAAGATGGHAGGGVAGGAGGGGGRGQCLRCRGAGGRGAEAGGGCRWHAGLFVEAAVRTRTLPASGPEAAVVAVDFQEVGMPLRTRMTRMTRIIG
jgi:hypothetical protein